MATAPQARAFFDEKAVSHQEKKVELPPQVAKYMVDGKLKDLSDEMAADMNSAVERIRKRRIAEAKLLPDASEVEVIQAGCGYYGKTEINAEMGSGKKAPYGMDIFYFAEEKREVRCYKLPGLGDNPLKIGEDYLKADENILGVGADGKVVPLVSTKGEIYCVKIKNFFEAEKDKEFAETPRDLAIAQSVRKSPSHENEWQQRIYMHLAPGMRMGNFFVANFASTEKLTLLECLRVWKNGLLAMKKDSHSSNKVHRDIKHENFHVTPGPDFHCRLLDFKRQESLTNGVFVSKALQGTAMYYAPEMVQAHLSGGDIICSHRTDLFAFGIIMAHRIGQIQRRYLDADDVWLLLMGGVKVDSWESGLFQSLFPDDVAARRYLLQFIESLTNSDPAKRPGCVDECVAFIENLEKFIRASKGAETGTHSALLNKQLEQWKGKAHAEPDFDDAWVQELMMQGGYS